MRTRDDVASRSPMRGSDRAGRPRSGGHLWRMLVLMPAVLGIILPLLACSPPGCLGLDVPQAANPPGDGVLPSEDIGELSISASPACDQARAAMRSMLLQQQLQGDQQHLVQSSDLTPLYEYMRSTGCPIHVGETHASRHNLSSTSNPAREDPLSTKPLKPSHEDASVSASSSSYPPQRSRRDAVIPGPVVACRLSSLIEGACGRPQSGSLEVLNVTFDAAALSPNNPIPSTAAEANLRDYSSAVQPQRLVLLGDVAKEALDFLISSGNWSSITHISIHGYDNASFHMDLLSPLQSLTNVDLSDNDLQSLTLLDHSSRTANSTVTPRLEQLLANIISLNLHNNHLEAAPTDVLNRMPALATLDLSENQIHALRRIDFQGLERTTTTTTLDLSANLIEEVEEGAFQHLSGLLHLDLSSNSIQQLPGAVFAPLRSLLTLDLSSNPIATLQSTLLRTLTSLTDLALTRTDIAALPKGIFAKNTQLTSLALYRNRLTSVPESTLHGLSKLTSVYFALNHITELHPSTFRDQANLEFLYLHNNPLGEVPANLLTPCRRLTNLQLQQCMLTALHPHFLASQASLDSLFLDGNELTRIEPELLQTPSATLTVLFLSRNRLTTFDVAMPNLLQIDLSANPIADNLPDLPSLLPRLNTFRMRNHHINHLDLTGFLHLDNLTLLDLSLEQPLTSTAFVDPAAIAATTSGAGVNGNSDLALRARLLQRLHMTYIGLGPNVLPALHALGTTLSSIYMGWPGMDEESVPMARLCELLLPMVSEFGLRNTGYKELTLCSNRNFEAVFLQDNRRLERVVISTGLLEQLNVSDSAQLQDLDVPPVHILDISGTRLQAQRALCTTLGSRMLFARRMPGMHFEVVESVRSLMRRCLQRVDLLDLSDNIWLSSPGELAPVTSKVTLLREAEFLTVDASQRLTSRVTPPMLVLERLPLSCSLRLTINRVRDLVNKDDVVSELGYLFHCECQRRFHLTSGGRCVPDQIGVDVIVGAAMGSAAGLAVICAGVYLLWRLITRIRGQQEHAQLLLDERDEEVTALKQVWEINYDDLRFVKKLTAGTYGFVYKGEWDTVTVAIKVLKANMMELDEMSVESFEKEVAFLQRTRHSNVVRFFGAGTNPKTNAPFLVLEFVELGSLEDLLDKKQGGLPGVLAKWQQREKVNQGAEDGAKGKDKVPSREDGMSAVFNGWPDVEPRDDEAKGQVSTVWDLKMRLLKDVVCGMAFIHSMGNVHRDLKSGNVLVSTSLRAKITDFGTIRRCFQGSASTTASSAFTPHASARTELGMRTENQNASLSMTTAVGTPLYMAPEVLTTDTYSSEADVYSFGVLMWEVAMERRPDLIAQERGDVKVAGPLCETLISLHRSGAILAFPSDETGAAVPEWYKLTSTQCMAADPKARPRFAELKDKNLRVGEESESS